LDLYYIYRFYLDKNAIDTLLSILCNITRLQRFTRAGIYVPFERQMFVQNSNTSENKNEIQA